MAGSRWAIEEFSEELKEKVGLGLFEVLRWDGWYRTTSRCSSTGKLLAMLVRAYLTIIRNQAVEEGEKGPLWPS